MSYHTTFLLNIYLIVVSLGHMEIFYNFLRNHKTFSTAAAPFYLSTSNAPEFQFLYNLANTFSIFLRIAICGCEVIVLFLFEI